MKDKTKRVWQIVLKLPLQLLVVAAWLVSFYAAATKMQNISWGTPIVFTILVALYVSGVLLNRKN